MDNTTPHILIASVDCGTTSIKAAVLDTSGRTSGLSEKPCESIYYKDGRIEQDADKIVESAFSCLKEAILRSRINPAWIKAVSVTNQRASVICADQDGSALSNAVSWQDMRGAQEIEKLKSRIDDNSYYNITGLPNNPVFSLGKILWIKKENSALYKKCDKFVLVADYLLRKLGTDRFFTDLSNASLTGMLDVSSLKWSGRVLKAAGIDKRKLGDLVPSGKVIGKVSREASKKCALLEGTPIVSGGGDQQCAGIGAGCVKKGVVEYTLGTAGVLLTCSDRVIIDPKKRVTCCVHAVPGKWEVEGLQNSASVCLDWLARLINSSKGFDRNFFKKLSSVKPGANGIFFYPYLSGASCPHWNPMAKAVFLGMALHHTKAEIARSVMEGVAFQTKEILDVFHSLKLAINQIRLTGGGSRIWPWNQIQADIYGRKVYTLKNEQATLLGAAILAAHGVGIFSSVEEAVDAMVSVKEAFTPDRKNLRIYHRLFKSFCAAYGKLEAGKVFELAVCKEDL